MSVQNAALSLSRSHWRGPAAALEALARCLPLLERAVDHALYSWSRYYDRRDDLVQAVFEDRATRVLRDQGFSTGSCPPRCPAAWLDRVFRNAALDKLRAWSRYDRRWVALEPDHVTAEQAAVDGWEVKRALAALTALPPCHALAWLARYAPDYLDDEWVRRACASERRTANADSGLVRGGDETWAGLERWRERHGQRTSSHAARQELAWVLRSTDWRSPEHWYRESPAHMKRALDTLGTWDCRARARLRRDAERP